MDGSCVTCVNQKKPRTSRLVGHHESVYLRRDRACRRHSCALPVARSFRTRNFSVPAPQLRLHALGDPVVLFRALRGWQRVWPHLPTCTSIRRRRRCRCRPTGTIGTLPPAPQALFSRARAPLAQGYGSLGAARFFTVPNKPSKTRLPSRSKHLRPRTTTTFCGRPLRIEDARVERKVVGNGRENFVFPPPPSW